MTDNRPPRRVVSERVALSGALLVLRSVQLLTCAGGVAFVQNLYRRLPQTRRVVDPLVVARRFATVSRFGPLSPRCVHRALATWGTLHRHGLRPELQHGVERGPDGHKTFHVWVTVDGKACDPPDLLQRYGLLEPAIVQGVG